MIGQLEWRSLANRRSDARLTMHVLQNSPWFNCNQSTTIHATMQSSGWPGTLIHWPTSAYQPAAPTMRRHAFPDLLYNGMSFLVTWLWPRQLIPSAAKLVNLTKHLWRSPLCNPQLVGATEYWKKKKPDWVPWAKGTIGQWYIIPTNTHQCLVICSYT